MRFKFQASNYVFNILSTKQLNTRYSTYIQAVYCLITDKTEILIKKQVQIIIFRTGKFLKYKTKTQKEKQLKTVAYNFYFL